jgi:APA family basic amino acid/polyamine antiporter
MSNLFRKKSIEQIVADARSGFTEHDFSEAVPQIEGEADSKVEPGGGAHLRRTLGLFDLTMLGIAAIIGAGIFSMVGKASYNGGPAVIFLFVFSALACGFAALCYAEFASRIPIAGSAYTYSYASMGELIAWIIGWDLIVEYAIGNIAVAISWSDYFTGLLKGLRLPSLGLENGIHIPEYLTMDYLSASRGFADSGELVQQTLAQGYTIDALNNMSADNLEKISENLNPQAIEAFLAWTNAPTVGGWRVIVDLPALAITLLITALVYIGIRESKLTANVMTVLKIGIILLVIFLGLNYVNPANWSPFAPNGVAGVLKGVSAVFFAYIGFDALATTAEEAKNPHRDLPLAMILSLVICTTLYIALTLVLTGMVSYKLLNVGDPLAFVFSDQGANLPWVAGIIAVSAVIAMATVFLVFQIGQPRLWMAMSRDGLLPEIFSSIHPRFKTPWFATIITGLVVAIPALFMNLTEVTDLASIGTLFAFVVVCAGVLFKDKEFREGGGRRYVPYINSQFILPVLLLIVLGIVYYFNPGFISDFFTLTPEEGESMLGAFSHKIPMIVYIILVAVLLVLSFTKKLSLIPIIGLLLCAYLMTELGITNWIRFGVWLLLGLIIYFAYGVKNSKLAAQPASEG